ncbi:MAG TPA: CpsB/CapC family capsule biosynthesis tyrosine phosphatase, partial [Ktedonobacteraceae bacterium]|nr:CpsB/CapC family capsule biosynthesis tyrosine phosphatase [Ktedonobacteraceae bacterium]
MIDTHLHILPGVDDGPDTLEETVALARALVQEGVRSAIATPHYNDEFPRRSASEIRARVNDAQQALDRQNIPLRLFAGHEALIKPGLVEDIQSGRLATLNGSRYLLLELWSSTWIPET